MTDNEGMQTGEAASAPARSGQSVQLGLRLQPVNHSEQPVYANLTVVQGAPGTVFIDFGFIEPNVMPGVARLAQSCGKLPEAIDGRLACRIVLGVDSAGQLAQQLEQHLRSLQPAAHRGNGGGQPS